MTSDRAILQLMQTPGVGGKTLARVLARLDTEGRQAEALLEIGRKELVSHYGLKADSAAAFGSESEAAMRLADRLEEGGIRLLTVTMPDYPPELKRVLKESAPPVLFMWGNISILQRQAAGICGSRDASHLGLKIAGDCAQMLAQCGVNVVSGYANGIDLAAHHGALEVEGVTTLVLAEGILHFRVKPDLRDLFDQSNSLVMSEFPPRLGWIARNAMLRNRTICGLSDVVIAVESGTSGGTFAAGQTALELRRPFFVIDYPTPPTSASGNRLLLSLGARPLHASEQGNLVNMMDVFTAMEGRESGSARDTSASQLSLDLA